MRYFLILFGLVSLILFSCQKKENVKDKIYGVWIFESNINNLYLNDTSGFPGEQYPLIYDFKENGDLVIKNYGDIYSYNSIIYNDTIFKWFLKSDSILTIDSLDYSIYSINNDSISLIDYNPVDTFWLNYKRPIKTKIDYSKKDIENILLSKIWSIEDSTNQEWEIYFEYFDNQTMIYRNRIFDRNFEDTADILQLETWGVAEYKGYFFLYSYMDMSHGNGNINRINQLIDVSPTSYTLLTSYCPIEKTKFVVKRQIDDNTEAIQRIKGNWISYNSKDKTYGKYIAKSAIESGWIVQYDGSMQLKLGDKKLILQIDTLKQFEYNWKLSKDARVLILEYYIEEPGRQGIHVEFADILELTDNKLKIRLFNNYFNTGQDKPYGYILNLIQEFERSE